MCGITGFIDFKHNSTPDVLDRMTDSLKHRGPNGRGTHLHSTNSFLLGFGHRRLAILELSELGKQPMFWNDWSIVFNGEIYNFQEIRAELIELGHEFVAQSDTEMILHAHDQWGTNCLNKFIGMFAFVLFNMKTNELFVARDRSGTKPLFLYQKNGLFLFASELKAFHEHPQFEKTIHIPAVHAFLQYGNVPTPHCIFEHCEKLKPGHFIHTIVNAKQVDLKQQQYWNVYDAYNAPKLDISIEEAKVETEKIMRSACEYRMVSDVPVGVFLSGGYDSTSVTALLQNERCLNVLVSQLKYVL